MASNQTHVVAFHNVPGKITVSGKVDCIGCSIASSKVRVTQESDTILALFVNTVSNFAIEQAEVISPLRSKQERHAVMNIMNMMALLPSFGGRRTFILWREVVRFV